MEKRSSHRLSEKFSIRFPCFKSFSSGTVTDISEDGMFIHTDMFFPVQSKFVVLIPFKDEILKVPVKIVRLVKKGKFYDGMGVKLLHLPKKYLEYLIGLSIR